MYVNSMDYNVFYNAAGWGPDTLFLNQLEETSDFYSGPGYRSILLGAPI
jgi:hypothetical protein